MEIVKNIKEEDRTNKICRLVLNFVHEEIIKQFIDKKGKCKESTFWLLKCISNDGKFSRNSFFFNNFNLKIKKHTFLEILLSGKLTKDYQYKYFISYLTYLYSKYIQLNDVESIIKIRNKLFDENSTRLLPYSMINDFKKTCLKSVIICFVLFVCVFFKF